MILIIIQIFLDFQMQGQYFFMEIINWQGLCLQVEINTLGYFYTKWTESESRLVVSDSLRPHGLYSWWNSPGQNTGVGSLSLLQGIFPTQGSNLGLPHCRWILYQLSHKGSPRPLVSLIFLKRSRLSRSVVFLYFFSLIAEESFLISSCYSLELCIQMFISFLFSFAFRFSSFHS